jgi:protocatechuate 3,4-dioxygenase beta subunit
MARSPRSRIPLLIVALAVAGGPDVFGQGGRGQPVPGAQQPPRDAQAGAAPVGTASMAGLVVSQTTGQALRRVQVRLSAAELRGGRTALTDDQGRFTFVALPAGRYTLTGSKPGYVSATYGQKQPGTGRPGTPIQLLDGQELSVSLALPKGGVLTGIVLDEAGEAQPGISVRALRYVLRTGERTLQSSGSAQTDDRGIYRIYGLVPGEYVVLAIPRNTNVQIFERMQAETEALIQRIQIAGSQTVEFRVASPASADAQAVAEKLLAVRAQIGQTDDITEGYAPVYYPGTTTPGSAVGIALGVSEERSGVDFQLQLVPVARVEGMVISPAGQAQGVRVSLASKGPNVPGVGTNSARADSSGRFRISNVAPGAYTLTARGTIRAPSPAGRAEAGGREGRGRGGPPALPLWAAADIFVDGQDLSNVALALQPGMSVSGRIAFQGTTRPPPTDLSRVRVRLTPFGGGDIASAATGQVDADGRFAVQGVMPGMYRVTASGASGWFIESALVGGRDALDFPFEVKPGENVNGAAIAFTDQQTELTGIVTDFSGKPTAEYTLIVFSSDRSYWTPQSRRIRSARPGTDGRFSIGNLPPGDYLLSAVTEPEPGQWFDPAYLDQLQTTSLRVSLAPGEKKEQSVRLSGGG